MLRDQPRTPVLYGVIAEFANPHDLLVATTAAYEKGYRTMDAYSPFPIHGLAEALGVRKTLVPRVVLIGAICGAAFGYGLQYFMAALSYVHNVGGRPVHSWPSFIPVTFETTVLFASISAVIGMFVMNGLPQPYHPVFNHPRYALASSEAFFLCIEVLDRHFDRDQTADFLRSQNPLEVAEIYD